MNVALTSSEQGDFNRFFKQIFFEEIQDKLPALPMPQFELLADMQYRAKLEGYSNDWPNAESYLISVDDQPAGKIILHEEAESIRIIDLVISKSLRGKGIGGLVLKVVGDNALQTGKEVRLSVARGNPAIHLYFRHGFKIEQENDTQIEMYKVCSAPIN